jgi:HK97 family phage prohead protease
VMRKAAEDRAAQYGQTPPGAADIRPCGNGRALPFKAVQLRAELVERDNRQFYRLDGYASVVEQPYEMWDLFGPYEEVISRGAFDKTLSAKPDVAFLVNHRGVTMARTTNGTLELSTDPIGLRSVAFLNPDRQDVRDLVSAVSDKLITEMSFGFTIPDGGATWAEDFSTFRIDETYLDRGDTSAVNYGANPYTSIAARSREIMRELQYLPAGAARAAIDQLRSRTDLAPVRASAADPQTGGSIDLYEALLGIE